MKSPTDRYDNAAEAKQEADMIEAIFLRIILDLDEALKE